MNQKGFNASWMSILFDDKDSLGGNGLIVLAAFLTVVAFSSSAAAIIFAGSVGLLGVGTFVLALFVFGSFLQPSSPKNKIWPILAGIFYGILAGGILAGAAALLLTSGFDSSIDFLRNLRP